MMSASKVWNCWWPAVCIVCPVVCATPGFAQDKVGEDQAFFITFQVPGSVNTFPAAVNNAGSVTGQYANASDAYQVFHAFSTRRAGAITTFDIQEVFPRSLWASTGRGPSSVNTAKRTTGTTAFVRSARGAITTFNVRGAMFITHSRRASTMREPSPDTMLQSMAAVSRLCARRIRSDHYIRRIGKPPDFPRAINAAEPSWKLP